MKNSIDDLNNHLFAQLERLGDEELTAEGIEKECKRAKSISDVASKLLDSASISLRHATLVGEYGSSLNKETMPKLLADKK